MTPEEMQELGFDGGCSNQCAVPFPEPCYLGFLADFVSGPQAMIWFLKNEASLHRIVSLRMFIDLNDINHSAGRGPQTEQRQRSACI